MEEDGRYTTVFNALTGLNQHTGNWSGKTVQYAYSKCIHENIEYSIVDLPGTYSLMAHSVEEELARDFICFGSSDVVIIVCDATCLERNLNLVLQTMEIKSKVIVCVNLMDEARKKGIHLNLNLLQKTLGVPVIGTSARSGQGLVDLMNLVSKVHNNFLELSPLQIQYAEPIETALDMIEPVINPFLEGCLDSRWLALRFLDYDPAFTDKVLHLLQFNLLEQKEVKLALSEANLFLSSQQISVDSLKDSIASSIVRTAETISNHVTNWNSNLQNKRGYKLDKLLTSKITGIPIMICLLFLVFWLTITGANYPSAILSTGFLCIQGLLTDFFTWISSPKWVHDILILGAYRVLAWVVSVMLPPMAIFFPLFTLLEDFGYLPRVAFNLDHSFKKCCSCGKQALCMCMGFGCNAVGITGCRIIDSPRERLIAIITNNFTPCNGRFPGLIVIMSMFFLGSNGGFLASFLSALFLTGLIVFSIFMTFLVSKLLSLTILKGVPSSFTLELPPYRRPQIGKVIIRSFFDRTLFVLGRAVLIAAPAGLVIWIFANITIGNTSILNYCTNFFDPFGRLIGLDGVILMAFILGFPANEIVIPIMLMAYLSSGSILELESITKFHRVLLENGWTPITAICFLLFSLMHWPCSTTCLTIKKETQNLKWTLVSFLVPTIFGFVACFIVARIGSLLLKIIG